MKIHKEGVSVIIVVFLGLLIVNAATSIFIQSTEIVTVIGVVSFLFFAFVLRFFRKPTRKHHYDNNLVYSPADGTIVAIEETEEYEYFQEKKLLVSVFMSVWDVHINWFPVAGLVKYFRYHPGKFLVARLPKSSTDNERTTVVIETKSGAELLVRQIAGAVARRIICYAKQNGSFKQHEEMGFIRFGSRLDVYLPADAKVNVEIGQRVRGTQTILAELS